jgi:hypothetical protein
MLGVELPEAELVDATGRLWQVKEPSHQATLVAIVSNDSNVSADDGVSGMDEQVVRALWSFPYLRDTDQHFAYDLGAACTPDFLLFDRDFRPTYRDAFDASSPKDRVAVTGGLLEDGIEHTVAGRGVPKPHRPAMGCGIKWLPRMGPEGS